MIYVIMVMIIVLKIAAALSSFASRPRSASDWNEHVTKSMTAVITVMNRNVVSSCYGDDDDDDDDDSGVGDDRMS